MATINDIKTLVADQLGLDPNDVTEDSRLVDDLGAESADLTNLTAAIEDRFGIKVAGEEAARFRTIRDIYAGVLKAGA
jgi:acyl carrier protein